MNWNYSYGDVVRVKHVPSEYCSGRNLIGVGLIGEVRSCYGDTISVKFPDIMNPRAGSGLYYFGRCHLEPIMTAGEAALNSDLIQGKPFALELDGEVIAEYARRDLEHTRTAMEVIKNMNEKKEEIPMLKNFVPAGIKFESGYDTDRVYTYALYDTNIVVGDLVVVNTGHHGMAVARVASIGETKKEDVACGREIICKVDTTAFEDRKAKAKSMEELKKEMDAMVQDLQAVALYELMAEKNPALATLLSEFKSLGA